MARLVLPPYPCPVCDEGLALRLIHSMPTDGEILLTVGLEDASVEHLRAHADELAVNG